MQSQNNLLLSTESRPPRLHLASCPKCNGISFPGIKRQGRVEDRLCVSGAKIKNWPGYTFPVSLNGIELKKQGDEFTFAHCRVCRHPFMSVLFTNVFLQKVF
jgi:hypothetical protein